MGISFSGKLTGSMTGYYKSSYEVDGKQKFYTLTQFEASLLDSANLTVVWLILSLIQPTAARRAFPCWDEPLLKATFAVTLISREDTVNLSNMPAISEDVYSGETSTLNESPRLAELLSPLKNEQGKWKITRFETTPPMSSYIVAYANGHFEYLEKSVVMPLSGKTLPLRIYGSCRFFSPNFANQPEPTPATADNIHQAQFALDVKASVLPLYEKVFDVEYPLPKLDTLVVSGRDGM